jgi:diguanylate cyclase (GGDEF)-like protein
MLRRILRHRSMARLALSVLALGFAVLASFAWVGMKTTSTAVVEIRNVAQTASSWDHVLAQVGNEDNAMIDYIRTPDGAGLEPLASAVGSAKENLRWLSEHGSAGNAGQVTLISSTYDEFTASLTTMVADGRHHNRTDLTAQADEASLSASSLRKQLTVGIQYEHLHLITALADVELKNQRLSNATLVVLAIDLTLVAFCGYLLLSYHRWIEQHAERNHHRAQHDILTGLANRALFEEQLHESVSRANDGGDQVTLLMLDLDGFKAINDTHGHQYGDLLIKVVADRLAGAVRRTDTVARLGGDEFAVLADHAGLHEATALAQRIRAAIAVPADLNGTMVNIGVSIGMARAPQHTNGPHELVRLADAAMYIAKRGNLGVVVSDLDHQPTDSEPAADPTGAPAASVTVS